VHVKKHRNYGFRGMAGRKWVYGNNTMIAASITCVNYCSDFVFDPVKWPRVQMEEDFLKLSQTFNAVRSVVRVPALDPKYKIAVLASKQVGIITLVIFFPFSFQKRSIQ